MLHNSVIPFILSVLLLSYDIYLIRKGKFIRLPFAHISIFVGFIIYILSFLFNDFTLKEVFIHSSISLGTAFKLSASWSGSGGFIVWWLFVFSLISFIYRFKIKECNKNLCIYHNLMTIALFITSLLNDAFSTVDFYPKNGLGLNPLLKSIWMLFHPPATFIGYALGLFVAINAFFNEQNKILINLAWIFITIANVLGAVWSYFTLGWGGYWAWDPVETALLLPWLILTAYFHSNKRYLLALTGFSVAFAAFVTRGGISPLHGFAVNPSGFVIILLGFPFLIKAIKDFRIESKLTPTSIATYSFLGSYSACLVGLVYQLLFKVNINVNYYNFVNMPFLVAILSILPICRAKSFDKKYLRYLAVIYIVSTALAFLATLGHIKWCEDAPIYVNSAISFIIPIVLFSFISILKLERIELKLIHISISLLVIALSISWPYAYYANYKSVIVDKDGVHVDGLKFQLVSIEFREPTGSVSIGRVEVPEECSEIVKLRVNDAYADCKIKLNLAWLLSGKDFIFSEPTVVNAGLDNYYIVIPSFHAFDLFMFTCKYLYENNETYILKCIANMADFDYIKLVESIEKWNPSGKVLIIYKRIPLINLVWISCALMIFGEIISLMRWRR